jgi:flagellar hook assembly protein FlgD
LYIALYDGDGPNSDNTRGEQVDIAPGPAWAASVDLESLARNGGATRTVESQGESTFGGKISYTVNALINPGQLTGFSADKTTFRPSAGEQIVVTANATGAPYTILRIHAYNSVGDEVWSIFGYLDTIGQTEKQFVWQGRNPNGDPLPPGTYKLKLQGFDVTTDEPAIAPLPPSNVVTVGGSLTQQITIAPPASVPSLTYLGMNPSPKWSPEVGDLSIRVSSGAQATISAEVFETQACSGTKIADISPVTVEPTRIGTLTWDGVTLDGSTVSLGSHGIKVSGTSGNAPTAPASICLVTDVLTAPPATLYAQHAPFLAQPGQTVELTANSVDPTGAPRVAGKLDVWGLVQSVPGSTPSSPSTPLRTCAMAATCTATIRLPSGGSFLSWRVTAEDRDGATIANSGWRGQRVMDASTFAQSTGFAVPIDAALDGPNMADARDGAKSLDLLFSVSTDFVWTSASDRQTIGDALDRFMTRMWGIAGFGAPAPTTFLKRPDLVRVYLTPERRVVSWNPAANMCVWSPPDGVWADARAVLHKTSCRDNADRSTRSFSAQLLNRDAILHELHHALFGLADEYPAGDGGYFENPPFANIFTSLARCTAVMGREPMGCTPITEIDRITRMPTGRTFFRLDASLPDIMVNNGTQRFADRSRANFVEGLCDAGHC